MYTLVCLGWIAVAQSVPIQILSITPISNGTASVTLKNTATEPIEAYAVTWFVSDVDSHGKPRHVGTRVIRGAAMGLTQKPLGPNALPQLLLEFRAVAHQQCRSMPVYLRTAGHSVTRIGFFSSNSGEFNVAKF